MVFNEYTMYHDDFLINAAILLNKVSKRKEEQKAWEAEQAAKNPPAEAEGEPQAKANDKVSGAEQQ